MKEVVSFPRAVREIENAWITLSDGCRLAARIWLPEDAEDDPVPAILEYLPYRKRDGTAVRDALTHPWFAGHGYACLRVDSRGNGESDGLMHDEYEKQEQDDAIEVIEWAASQPWCSGTAGMIGISWGGFNGLQVAARRPAPLKAIVTLCSTDDRYADDIHYKGGCLLNENLGWASTMLAYSARPPDPALVGERWREMWLHRLENMPILAETWLRHQGRDDYWKHGSVCEDYGAIEAAVLAVGGWGDAYRNAIPRLLAGLKAPARGIIGPWTHKYPHFAPPAPRIGFLQECLRWWDHWLKGVDNDVMSEPTLRAYVMDSARPAGWYVERPGRWVAERDWPSPAIGQRRYRMQPGRLVIETNADETGDGDSQDSGLTLSSPQSTGQASGEYCAIWLGPDWPVDQRQDDGGSLLFDTAPLDDRLEILGSPAVDLEIASDHPLGFVAVRLCDVHEDGASTRISYGVLNLSHREGHETPRPLVAGETCRVRVELDMIGYAVPPGHRLRVAVSNAYWPLIWPSPEAARLTVYPDGSRLSLPVRPTRNVAMSEFAEAEGAPAMQLESLREGRHERRVEKDLVTGETRMHLLDDFGTHRNLTHGLESGGIAREIYRIRDDDPLSARAETHWTETVGRGDWQTRIEARQEQWCDQSDFHLRAELEAFEGQERVFHRIWKRSVARDGN